MHLAHVAQRCSVAAQEALDLCLERNQGGAGAPRTANGAPIRGMDASKLREEQRAVLRAESGGAPSAALCESREASICWGWRCSSPSRRSRRRDALRARARELSLRSSPLPSSLLAPVSGHQGRSPPRRRAAGAPAAPPPTPQLAALAALAAESQSSQKSNAKGAREDAGEGSRGEREL